MPCTGEDALRNGGTDVTQRLHSRDITRKQSQQPLLAAAQKMTSLFSEPGSNLGVVVKHHVDAER